MHLFVTDFHFVSPIIITSAHPRCVITPPGQSPRFAMGDYHPKARLTFVIPLKMKLHPHREARKSRAEREVHVRRGKKGYNSWQHSSRLPDQSRQESLSHKNHRNSHSPDEQKENRTATRSREGGPCRPLFSQRDWGRALYWRFRVLRMTFLKHGWIIHLDKAEKSKTSSIITAVSVLGWTGCFERNKIFIRR